MSIYVQPHNHQAWLCLERDIRLYMFLQTHQGSWKFVCSVQENMKQNIKSECWMFWNLTFHRGEWWLRVCCIVVCVAFVFTIINQPCKTKKEPQLCDTKKVIANQTENAASNRFYLRSVQSHCMAQMVRWIFLPF